MTTPQPDSEQLAEQMHNWYLEIVAQLAKSSYNPEAVKPYAELSEEQRHIDRYMADKVQAFIATTSREARTGRISNAQLGEQSEATKPLTFVVYRTEAKALKSEFEKDNYLDSDQVQFEGVEFWDGTVAIRWRTPTTSMSFWDSMESLKKVHIYAHPDYGTRVVWSDGRIEEL